MFERSEDTAFAVDRYIFHPAKRLLRDSITKKRIWLTEKEAAILKYLYRSDARSVGRQKLLHEVWGYDSGCRHSHVGNAYLSFTYEN